MHNWYKKAQEHIESNPNLIPSDMELLKEKLQKKFPKVNWTIEMVKEWAHEHFGIGKAKPFTGPKDLEHKF